MASLPSQPLASNQQIYLPPSEALEDLRETVAGIFFHCYLMVMPWPYLIVISRYYAHNDIQILSSYANVYVYASVAAYMLVGLMVWRYGLDTYNKCMDSSQLRQAQLDFIVAKIYWPHEKKRNSHDRAQRRRGFVLHLTGKDVIWRAAATGTLMYPLDAPHFLAFVCASCAMCLELPLHLACLFATDNDWSNRRKHIGLAVLVFLTMGATMVGVVWIYEMRTIARQIRKQCAEEVLGSGIQEGEKEPLLKSDCQGQLSWWIENILHYEDEGENEKRGSVNLQTNVPDGE